MLQLTTLVLAAAEAEENALPVPSVVFPLIAAGVFALLGAVAWSYRDVANRHAGKSGGTSSGAGH